MKGIIVVGIILLIIYVAYLTSLIVRDLKYKNKAKKLEDIRQRMKSMDLRDEILKRYPEDEDDYTQNRFSDKIKEAK